MIELKKFYKFHYKPTSKLIHELWAVVLPSSYAKYVYKKTRGKKLDLKNPKDFYEKNYWLRAYSDLAKWTELADKYKVRNYVKKCGLDHILVKLYGSWDKAEDIDFSVLPEKFVLKTNHGFGKNILVHDKSQLDLQKTRKQLNKWLKEKHGLLSFEPHYWNISRKIIAEEFLQDCEREKFSSTLIDYKLFCINGEPYIINVYCDRRSSKVELQKRKNEPHARKSVFDLNWNVRYDLISEPYKEIAKTVTLPKPKRLDEMIKIARILSKPFPQVRVDLYEVNGRVYFGEMTFTPGHLQFFIPEHLEKMGEKMDLSLAKPRTKRFIV